MLTQKFIKIFYSVQELGPFSLFQNLALGKASTDDKCHFAIPWARSCQYQCVCRTLSKYSKRVESKVSLFSVFEPRLIPNFIWLYRGLHHVNINVYAKFHHNIPLSSRDRAIFTFFQNLEFCKATTNKKCHFAISWARSYQYQCLRKSLSNYSTQFKR